MTTDTRRHAVGLACTLVLMGLGVVQGQAALQSVEHPYFTQGDVCRLDFGDLGFTNPGAPKRVATRSELNARLAQHSACIRVEAGELWSQSSYLPGWAVLEAEGGEILGEIRLSFVEQPSGKRTGVRAVGMPLSELENVKVSVAAFGESGETIYTGTDLVFPLGKRDYGYYGIAGIDADPRIWEVRVRFSPVVSPPPTSTMGFVAEWPPFGAEYSYDIAVRHSVADAPERILFHSNRDGNSEVYAMRADGSLQTRLTMNPAFDGFAAWSPDHDKIAFDSNRDGVYRIYVMDPDGTGVRRLSDTSGTSDRMPCWSPDGASIAYDHALPQGRREIWTMTSHGSGHKALAGTSGGGAPTWSPDGNWIAFDKDRFIYVVAVTDRAAAGEPTRLTKTDELQEYHPSWSPDGRRIAFHARQRSLGGDAPFHIYVVARDTNEPPRRIAATLCNDDTPSWSADGRRIIFTRTTEPGNGEIFSVDPDAPQGTAATNLTQSASWDGHRWGVPPS